MTGYILTCVLLFAVVGLIAGLEIATLTVLFLVVIDYGVQKFVDEYSRWGGDN